MTADIIPDSGTVIQVDGAIAFQTLERESKTDNTLLYKLKIRMEIGRLLNKNKNTSVEIANKELVKEIPRVKPNRGQITKTNLCLVLQNINTRIRYHRLSSKEIVFRRHLIDKKENEVMDEDIAQKQLDNRVKESVMTRVTCLLHRTY